MFEAREKRLAEWPRAANNAIIRTLPSLQNRAISLGLLEPRAFVCRREPSMFSLVVVAGSIEMPFDHQGSLGQGQCYPRHPKLGAQQTGRCASARIDPAFAAMIWFDNARCACGGNLPDALRSDPPVTCCSFWPKKQSGHRMYTILVRPVPSLVALFARRG
ncbi:hypothetical protein BDW71DRAFT_80771 [Aspergillus fruticulosus]